MATAMMQIITTKHGGPLIAVIIIFFFGKILIAVMIAIKIVFIFQRK